MQSVEKNCQNSNMCNFSKVLDFSEQWPLTLDMCFVTPPWIAHIHLCGLYPHRQRHWICCQGGRTHRTDSVTMSNRVSWEWWLPDKTFSVTWAQKQRFVLVELKVSICEHKSLQTDRNIDQTHNPLNGTHIDQTHNFLNGTQFVTQRPRGILFILLYLL